MILEEFDEEKYLETVEERGIQIGEKRRQISTAKKLLESHVDRQIILTATGITEEELNEIEQGEL